MQQHGSNYFTHASRHLASFAELNWFLHCPPCRYLVNLFIYDYLLKGLLQIVLVLILRLMGDGLDHY